MAAPRVPKIGSTKLIDLVNLRADMLQRLDNPELNSQTAVAIGKLIVELSDKIAEIDPAYAAKPEPRREETPVNDFADELARRRAARAVSPVEAEAT